MTCSRWLLLLVAALSSQCGTTVGTPQTDPPNLDPGLLTMTFSRVKTPQSQVTITGGAGAADPPGAIVHIVNLDTQDAEVTATVGADGSLATEIAAADGQILRLQVRDGANRSHPVDLVVRSNGAEPSVPTLPCVTTDPAAEIVFGSLPVAHIELRNQCEQAVVANARLRAASSAFTIGELPTRVEAGASVTLSIEHAASNDGSTDENVLLIDISSPTADRRAITLIGGS